MAELWAGGLQGPYRREATGGRIKAHPGSELQCKCCPQLCQLSFPAPANKHAANKGWGDTGMPWHPPRLSTWLLSPFLISLSMFACWCPGLGRASCMGQSPTPASPGGTGIFLTEPPDQALVMLQGGGTQRGVQCQLLLLLPPRSPLGTPRALPQCNITQPSPSQGCSVLKPLHRGHTGQ